MAAATSHTSGLADMVDKGAVTNEFTLSADSGVAVYHRGKVAELPLDEDFNATWQDVSVESRSMRRPRDLWNIGFGGERIVFTGEGRVDVSGLAGGEYAFFPWGCETGTQLPENCRWLKPRVFYKSGPADMALYRGADYDGAERALTSSVSRLDGTDWSSARVQEGSTMILWSRSGYEGEKMMIADDASTLNFDSKARSVKISGGVRCSADLYREFGKGWKMTCSMTYTDGCQCWNRDGSSQGSCDDFSEIEQKAAISRDFASTISAVDVHGGDNCAVTLYDEPDQQGQNITLTGASSTLDMSGAVESVSVDEEPTNTMDIVAVPYHYGDGDDDGFDQFESEVRAMIYGEDADVEGFAHKGPFRNVDDPESRVEIHYLKPDDVTTPTLRKEPKEPYPCTGEADPGCSELSRKQCKKVDSCYWWVSSVGISSCNRQHGADAAQVCEDVNDMYSYESPGTICEDAGCTWHEDRTDNLPQTGSCSKQRKDAIDEVERNGLGDVADLILVVSEKPYTDQSFREGPIRIPTSGCGWEIDGVPVAAVGERDDYKNVWNTLIGLLTGQAKGNVYTNTYTTFYHEAGHAFGFCHNYGKPSIPIKDGDTGSFGECDMDDVHGSHLSMCANDLDNTGTASIMNYCQPRERFSADEMSHLNWYYRARGWIK